MEKTKLTDEQLKKIKGMIKLSKVSRICFLGMLVLGGIVSLVGSLVGGSAGTFLLYVSFVLFLVALLFAVVLFANLQRVKIYCKSLGVIFH